MDFPAYIFNLSLGRAKSVYINGREYLTGKVSSLNPGILHGSEGALLYPEEDVKNSVGKWEKIPLTVYHPEILGAPASAKDPGVLEKQGAGWIQNDSYNGKLQHQFYLDVEKAERIDNTLPEHIRILPRIRSGQPVEVSTGLYTENEDNTTGELWNGQYYTAIAKNYRPDHLAILPDQVGACSVNDGCGILVNQNTKSVAHDMDNLLTRFIGWLVGNAGIVDNGGPGSGRHPLEGLKKRDAIERITRRAVEGKWFKSKAESDAHAWLDKTEKHRKGDVSDHISQAYKEAGLDDRGRQTTNASTVRGDGSIENPSSPQRGGMGAGGLGTGGGSPEDIEDRDEENIDEEEQVALNRLVDNGGPGSGRHAGGGSVQSMQARTASKVADSMTAKAISPQQHVNAANTHYDAANAHKVAAANDPSVAAEHKQAAAEHISQGDSHIRMSKGMKNARHETSGRYLSDKPAAGAGNVKSEASKGMKTGVTDPNIGKGIGRFDTTSATDTDTLDELNRDDNEVEDVDGDLEGGDKTGKSGTPPMLKNQFSLSPDAMPHEASKQACASSMMAEHPEARSQALSAVDASSEGNSKDAAMFHKKAAGLHEAAATEARVDDEQQDAEMHDNAAALHRKAASMHRATTNSLISNEFASDEQRMAFFGMLGDHQNSMSKDAWQATRQTYEKKGTSESHKAAAESHKAAAKSYEKSGNKEMMKGHKSAASYHNKQAKLTSNTGDDLMRMLDRKTILGRLAANCSCTKTKQSYNSLPTKVLVALAKNANIMKDEEEAEDEGDDEKAIPEMNEESEIGEFGGAIDSGGYDTNPDEKVAPQLKKKGMEKKGIQNFLATHGTAEDREAWNNVMTANKNMKIGLIKRLISHVPTQNKELRRRLISNHMKKSIPQLKDEIAALPSMHQAHNARTEDPTDDLLNIDTMFAPGKGISQTHNSAGSFDDDLLVAPTLNFNDRKTKEQIARETDELGQAM